ncbi:MAG: NME NM23 member 5 [Marteilia pararefringens]
MSYCVAIIKPDAVNNTKSIIKILKSHQIFVIKYKRFMMDCSQSEEYFSEIYDSGYYDELIEYMSSGSIDVLLLYSSKNLFDALEAIIGPGDVEEAKEKCPDSLIAIYGSDNLRNAISNSPNEDIAKREIKFFFPEKYAEIVTDNEHEDEIFYRKKMLPVLNRMYRDIYEKKPEDCRKYMIDWIRKNNNEWPEAL